MRQAVLTPFFGALRDRFCEYQQPLPIVAKLVRAASIHGVEGVEIVFPDECQDVPYIKRALAELNLQIAAINVNLKGLAEFRYGALSSPDPGVRGRALEFLCAAKRLALELGADKVTCAPLADGYDYPFQIDYRLAWARMADVLGEAATFLPEIFLHIEHKPSEPRTRGLLDSASKVLCLLREIRHPQVGITFNAGHAFYGGGIPASEFAHVLAARIPYYIHYCDGTPDWDWDLMAASGHYFQWVEFLFYLKQDGYAGWMTADTFPMRQDAGELFAANIRRTNQVLEWLDTLDTPALYRELERDHAMPMMRKLEKCLP